MCGSSYKSRGNGKRIKDFISSAFSIGKRQGIGYNTGKAWKKRNDRQQVDLLNDQYYLIRAANSNADKFYHGFPNAEVDEEPFLRKELKE